MLARELHPAAWWLWALGLAAAASRTLEPWLLVIVVLVACVVVAARRTDAPWALSFRIYLWFGALVITLRVVFRILFGGGAGEHVLLDLPEVPLPDWVAGITLLGPLTREALLSGLYDGMRLAAILICIGAANALANPRRLLASTPPALYEMGTTIVVALSLFPQLGESVQRVRRARRLRGANQQSHGFGRVKGLRSLIVPVLEDALERSMSLAASMDARGYGRSGDATPRERRTTGSLLVASLLAFCIGIYAVLDPTAPRWLAGPMLGFGVAVAVVGFWSAGRRVARTRYRPDPWRLPETLTGLSGLVAAVSLYVDSSLSLVSLVGVLVGLLPAVSTPEPEVIA